MKKPRARNKNKVFVLSIDGGGMRGIIPAKILAELEQRSGKPIAKMFQLIAGTSTGGILALALTLPATHKSENPKFSASDIVALFKKFGVHVFGKRMLEGAYKLNTVPVLHEIVSKILPYTEYKYKSKGLRSVLQKHFGNARLSDSLTNLLIPAYDLSIPGPQLFKSHRLRTNSAENYKMVDVARATSAAPAYFQPKQIPGTKTNLIDGGVILNDPSMAAYVEALTKIAKTKASEIIIVSLGTGASALPIAFEKSKNWGEMDWVKPMLNATMDGVSSTTEYMLQVLADSQKNLTYYRLNPKIDPQKTAMDEAANIDYWEKIADDFIHAKKALLQEIVEVLTNC
jgi:patatin-like phospholipase/acyl hydrolase